MSDDADRDAGRRKILELIDGIDYANFTTRARDSGAMHARPMATRQCDDDGDLWFFTKKDSRKVEEIGADPQVLVTFADPKKQHFVSITGRSEVVSDRARVKAMWAEIYRTWFPGGPEDENIVLIRVAAEHAEYWDTPNSVAVVAYGYLKALTTGKPNRAGEIGKVDLA